MYLAQLDTYLKEKVGMTPKEIKGKGFTFDKKVDFIRKHVLKQDNNDTGVTNNRISVPTMTTVPRPASGHSTAISIIPWSGSIKRHGIVIELINTCPIDNFLMMFNYLSHVSKAGIHLLPAPLPQVFTNINNHIKNTEFGEAKNEMA